MEEKKLVPKLRFPGFTEPWEQRKLGEIADIIGGGTPSTSFADYWDGDIDWYSPVEICSNRYVSDSIRKITKLGLEKSSTKILPVGTILFTSRAGIGNTAILRKEGCTNQGFQSIIPRKNLLDTYFLYTLTPQLKRYGELMGAGSTFVEVSGRQMEKMPLNIPSLGEQKKVGKLFEILDDSITLHQRKLEHLKLKKKSLLQKLFPKEGEVYPELRFPGFTNPWEQRKLGELYKPRREKNDGRFGKDKIISVANMYFKNDVKLATSEYLLTYNVFLLGDIAFEGHCNNSFSYGRFVENSIGDGIVSHVFDVLMPNTKCCINYWKVFINYEPIMGKILRRCTNSSRMMANLELKAFLKETINIPTIKEQQKIGNFLEQFDQYITLHQRKLEHLQLLKKALLQQLFV